MVTLVETDLLSDIGRDELDGLAKSVLESGQPEPIPTEIADSLGIIEMYVSPWLIKPDFLKRLWRLLVISGLYNRLGRLPVKRKEERDWVMSVLKEIRDGKFTNLLLDPEVPVAEISGGSFGSDSRVNLGAALTIAPTTSLRFSDET